MRESGYQPLSREQGELFDHYAAALDHFQTRIVELEQEIEREYAQQCIAEAARAAEARECAKRERERRREQRELSAIKSRSAPRATVVKPLVKAIPKKAKEKVQHKRWRDWEPLPVDDVQPVLEVKQVEKAPESRSLALCSEIDQRGAAIMSWAPWERRNRRWRSRRYEGYFHHG